MFTLFENKKIKAVVVYGNHTDTIDETAVSELCYFVRKCSIHNAGSDDLRAYPKIPADAKNIIFIGSNNEYISETGISIPKNKFLDDTIYIAVKNNFVILDGGKRGKLYAIYEFLERFLNVRFYSPEKSYTPFKENLYFEDSEIIYTPKISYRCVYSNGYRFSREFCARNRINCESDRLGLNPFGGTLNYSSPGCHTTFNFLFPVNDPETGFCKHPEYYSYLMKYGKRVGRKHDEFKLGFLWGEGEICWTNEKVIKILTERIKRWILDTPNTEYYSLSQNDWPDHCECPKCLEIAKKYGINGEPRWSAPIIFCVNKIAKSIKLWQKKDPILRDRKIIITTEAYQYSTMPPNGMKVEDNVAVRLITHECCFKHKFSDEKCPINKQFGDAIKGWAKIVKNIFIWDYATNHGMHCAFNTILDVYQDNIKFFANNNVLSIFEEYTDKVVGPWYNVRQYLFARVLWNQDINFHEEFCDAMKFFYEEAAPYLIEIERLFTVNTNNIENFHPRLAYTILPEHYSKEFLNLATQLFEIALSKVTKEETKLAVKREYIYLKWTKMYLNRENDFASIQSVCDEMKVLGIEYNKIDSILSHYFGGEESDNFKKSIEDRNRKDNITKLLELSTH